MNKVKFFSNLFFGFSTILFVGCSSSAPKVESINTKLEESQAVSSSESIGKNQTGELVYQQKINVVNELVKLEDEVTDLQDRVYGTQEYNSKGLYGKAQACRKKKAMKTGELTFIPERSPVIEKDQVKIGQDMQSKKVIGITEEALSQRLERFKEYKKTLYSRQEQLESYIEKCEVEIQQSK